MNRRANNIRAKQIGKQKLKSILAESAEMQEPMQVVASFHNAFYCRMKAIELLSAVNAENFQEHCRQAITLIALARYEVENDSVETTESEHS